MGKGGQDRHWPITPSLPLFYPPLPTPMGWGQRTLPSLWPGVIPPSLPRQPAREESPDLLLLAVSWLDISVNPSPQLTNKTYTQSRPSINVFQPLILFVAVFEGALIQRAMRAFPPIYLLPINVLSPHCIQPDKGEASARRGGHLSPDLSHCVGKEFLKLPVEPWS